MSDRQEQAGGCRDEEDIAVFSDVQSVTTLERYRRHGVARARVAAAAVESTAAGCDVLCLNTAA